MTPLRWLRRGMIGLLTGVLIAMGAFLFLERVQRGQRVVLDYALGRIRGAIAGTIEIGGIASTGLLGGATLTDVTVRGEDGRPFLTIDRVEAAYAWKSFLSGDVILSKLDVYGPRLTISRYPGEETFNLDRIFRLDERTGEPPSTRSIELEDVRIVDGFIEILLPVDAADPPPPRALTTAVPGVDGAFQHIFFEAVQARIADALLVSPDGDPEVTVRSASLTGHVYEDPLTLTNLEGRVAWADGKLTVDADELALPNTRASGTIVVDLTREGRGGREKGWAVALDLESPRYALADLHWLLPQLPAGEGEGAFDVRFDDLGAVQVAFSESTLEMDGSRLSGEGTILRDGDLRVQGIRLRADPLEIEQIEAFTGELPLGGIVAGTLVLDGPVGALRARGEVTLEEPERAPVSGTFSGTFNPERRAVTGLVADLAEVDYALLSLFAPASRLAGTGRAHVEATGSFDEGIAYRTELVHVPGGELPTSEVVAAGTVRKVGEELVLEVDAEVSPLSLTALRSYYPELSVSGEVTGRIHAVGPVSDLAVTTDLDTPAGRLALEARFDGRDPGAFYRAQGELGSFTLSELFPALPEPTVLSGYVELEGRGTDAETASVDARLVARGSRVGELDVDSAVVSLRVRDGVLHVDSADALASGVVLHASGTMATHEEGPRGEMLVTFEAESLEGLRPVLMERNILVKDGLTELQMQALRAQGIEPDTLPTADEVALAGSASGSVTFTGSLQRFAARGSASLDEVRLRTLSLHDVDVTFSAEDLPDLGAVQARVVADSIRLAGRSFRSADAQLAYVSPVGFVDLDLVRDDTEDYQARARFALDSLGGRVQLETLTLRLDTLSWELEEVGLFSWDAQAIRVANISLMQSGGEGVRVVGAGVLPREGEAAFELDVRGLELAQVVRLFQIEDVQMEGLVDLDILIAGTAEQPVITSAVNATGLRYQGYAMELVSGELEYRSRRLAVDLGASQDGRRVLTMTGAIPAVVNFTGPEIRLPDEEIDLRVVAESLPAAFVAGIFPVLVDVEGTVAGTFGIAGTLDQPSPSGSLTLQGAAWTVEPIGVRHENVTGGLTLRPDGTMEVNALARADGMAHMTGTVRLAPLRNPTFDLQVAFDNFRAADRRDVVGNVSGVVRLTGTFDRPLIEGLGPAEGLRVESGVLFLEEAVRAATVVDLADPRFREFLNESLLDTRVIAESQNPFMQNLRVNVDLAVAQDTWLRSTEMNVEIAGDLRVSYDRARLSLVLTGVLDARRGQYDVLGRRFQVREGQVEFLGTPGVDPELDIQADTRVRMQNGEQLDITARVTGRLTEPRVTLSSDEGAIGQSDLVSYLLFGRPSYELASGEQAVLGGAARSFVGSYAVGTVATRIGSALAQQWGLDYFAITEIGTDLDFGSVSQAQVEFGRYLSQDLFVVMAFKPAQVVSTLDSRAFGQIGVRLEYRPTERYTLESFFEDRFLRSRGIGFQDVALNSQKVLGLSLFREWGY
jgi:autotransporter translocation and assembly factor TamB